MYDSGQQLLSLMVDCSCSVGMLEHSVAMEACVWMWHVELAVRGMRLIKQVFLLPGWIYYHRSNQLMRVQLIQGYYNVVCGWVCSRAWALLQVSHLVTVVVFCG